MKPAHEGWGGSISPQVPSEEDAYPMRLRPGCQVLPGFVSIYLGGMPSPKAQCLGAAVIEPVRWHQERVSVMICVR